jgi:ABC-type multidrug transport system fused ATPase/permease subunit
MSAVWVEWIGYIASIVVLISLLMSSVVKLRWINMVGALFFTLYGSLIGSTPVALVNFCIALIDLYYLYQYYKSTETFTFINADMDSDLFNHFLSCNREEIEKQISLEALKKGQKALYMLRDNNIAGIMVGDRKGDELEIKLDYVTPRYQDFKIGEYYFLKHPEVFTDDGIKKLITHASEENHRKYLEKMGFRRVVEDDNTYKKIL